MALFGYKNIGDVSVTSPLSPLATGPLRTRLRSQPQLWNNREGRREWREEESGEKKREVRREREEERRSQEALHPPSSP
jgi:hypothetical protein